MSNIRAAMNRGAFDFVTKPIDFTDLEKTIAKTVRRGIEFLRQARQRQVAAERAYASLSRYFSPNLGKAVSVSRHRRDRALWATPRNRYGVFRHHRLYRAGGDA